MADPSGPLVTLFKSLGLGQAKALEAAKSPKSAAILKELIEKYSLTGLDEKTAGLVAALAGSLSKTGNVGDEERKYVLDSILEGKLKSVDQVAGASRIADQSSSSQHRSGDEIRRIPFCTHR